MCVCVCVCVCALRLHIAAYLDVTYQGLIDSKEKKACNLVPIEIQTNGTKAAKVTKNSTLLLLV